MPDDDASTGDLLAREFDLDAETESG